MFKFEVVEAGAIFIPEYTKNSCVVTKLDDVKIKDGEIIIAKKTPEGYWITKMTEKRGFKEDSIRKHFKLKEDENVTIKMIDDELKKIEKRKLANGKYSESDLKLVRQLNAAKNMIKIKK